MRLSLNAEGVWDMRAQCECCGVSFSRTCKPPPEKGSSRPVTRVDGQGRPVGKLWAWLQQADVLPRNHAKDTHRHFSASLAERIAARQSFAAQQGAELWLSHERRVNPSVDTPEGEPRELP